jgi:quaternary ammonium compound-resistance protein SugE
VTVVAVIGGIGFLTLAMRTLPVGVAYPIWVAAGALGAVLLGALAFGETLTPLKLASVAVIVLGVIGLKLSGAQS